MEHQRSVVTHRIIWRKISMVGLQGIFNRRAEASIYSFLSKSRVFWLESILEKNILPKRHALHVPKLAGPIFRQLNRRNSKDQFFLCTEALPKPTKFFYCSLSGNIESIRLLCAGLVRPNKWTAAHDTICKC